MRHVLLLRGINLAGRRRIPMAQLREVLGEAGYEDVQTHLQSGNVVLESPERADAVGRRAGTAIAAAFGFDVPVLVRSHRQLAAIVERDPHGEVADEPKLYQVAFLERPVDAAARRLLEGLLAGDERFAAHRRELYTWHPHGIGRSRLATGLGGDLGMTVTVRNWRTVTALLEMSS